MHQPFDAKHRLFGGSGDTIKNWPEVAVTSVICGVSSGDHGATVALGSRYIAPSGHSR